MRLVLLLDLRLVLLFGFFNFLLKLETICS